MKYFNKNSITFLVAQVNHAKKNMSGKAVERLDKLNALLNSILEVNLEESLSQEDIADIQMTMEHLQELTECYAQISDIGSIELYDDIKKKFVLQLSYLSSHKDKVANLATYAEDLLKKEFYSKLISKIEVEEGCSTTKAKVLIEGDIRYINLKKQVKEICELNNLIKIRYSFFTEVWKSAVQSVSTANKEKNMIRHE